MIDQEAQDYFYKHIWQSNIHLFKHSGDNLVDEINALKPKLVIDAGCGINYLKNKIHNLIGYDPVFEKEADIVCGHWDAPFKTECADVILALGSINFGSTDKVFAELEHAVSLCAEGGTMYFRVNPGLKHEPPESEWISFYNWDANFITNCASYFGVSMLDMRNDSKDRIYFVWRKS